MFSFNNIVSLFVLRKVYLSFISIIVFLLFLFFYRYLYPKKRPSYVLALLLISCLPCVSLLVPGSFESGDLSTHATFTMAFYDNLKQGLWFPKWAGILNAGYGYPLFNFTYPLPFYLTSFYHFLGFGYLASVKLLLFSTFVLSGFFMYLWVKEEINSRSAFVASVFYLFAPYHLIDMHFRVAIGEMVALMFLPLIMYLAKKYSQNLFLNRFILFSLSVALLILSHQSVSLLALPVIIVYLYLSFETSRFLRKAYLILKVVLTSSLLTIYYWLPAIVEDQFTHVEKAAQMVGFPKITTYLFSPYRMGFLFQGNYGELVPIVGYVQVIVVVCLIVLLIRKKLTTAYLRLGWLFSIIFLVYFLGMQKPFSFVYQLAPFLGHIQFPYRLQSVIMLSTSFLAGILITGFKNKKIVLFLVVLAILPTILNWTNRKILKNHNDQYLVDQLKKSPSYGEIFEIAAPKWLPYGKLWQTGYVDKQLEILEGKASIFQTNRTNTQHYYQVKAATNLKLKENTLFFPGWELRVDGQRTEINYLDQNYLGIITFSLDKGDHTLELVYEDTPLRKITKIISFGVGLFLLLSWVRSYFQIDHNKAKKQEGKNNQKVKDGCPRANVSKG